MGWKASLVIIENLTNFKDDNVILNALGKRDYQFSDTVQLHECLSSGDGSIAIGYYNNNIIIADDYTLTEKILQHSNTLSLSLPEKALVQLFPQSEIISIACHSAVNYHGYSIIEKGIKKRIKTISADDEKIELGLPISEESQLYEQGYEKNGNYYWPNDFEEEDLEEDQMMEDFTFGVAKRRIGVSLDQSDGEELIEKVKFIRYTSNKSSKDVHRKRSTSKKQSKWIQYAIIIGLLILWRVFKRLVLQD